MAKGLSITQVQMYCTMVGEKFQVLYKLLNEKRDQQKEAMTDLVRRELGIYDQMKRIADMKMEIENLENEVVEIACKKGVLSRHRYYNIMDGIDTGVTEIVNDRMTNIAKLECLINANEQQIQNKIKLAMIGQEVLDVFAALEQTITKLSETISKE